MRLQRHSLSRRLLRTLLAIASASVSLSAGCVRPSVVLVPVGEGDGEPIQLAQDVRAHVYVELQNGDRVPSRYAVDLKEGWWVVPYDPR